MRTRLEVIFINQGFFNSIRRMFDRLLKMLFIRIMRHHYKVQNNKIIFLNFSGNYDCNQRGICDELIRQKLNVKLVWGVYKKTPLGPQFFPEQVRPSLRKTFQFYRDIASSKIIVDNGITTAFEFYPKKKDQILIETWHGSLGIKKFGKAVNNDKKWIKNAEKEAKMTDFIISNSDFEDAVYREDFWKKTTIWKFGHPRNDILFIDDEKAKALKKKICDEFEISEDAKLCMYAPTFREDGDLRPYLIDYTKLKKALEERFGGDWIILTRFHPRTKKYVANYKLPSFVVNASDYIDIQDLLRCIDIGITDYSSWICEYMLRRKPGFMFALDYENYVANQRELYYPLTDLPFPVASNIDDLIKNIKEFDDEKFLTRCEEFLKEKGSVDDGKASERVVNEIRKIINQ